MSGSIPPELGQLSSLKVLNTYNSVRLTGCVPNALQDTLDMEDSELGHLTFCE